LIFFAGITARGIGGMICENSNNDYIEKKSQRSCQLPFAGIDPALFFVYNMEKKNSIIYSNIYTGQ
jgi:hypothetical protein